MLSEHLKYDIKKGIVTFLTKTNSKQQLTKLKDIVI